MTLPRRILTRVETLERRLCRSVPAELSAAARALLDEVLRGMAEPPSSPQREQDARP